MEIGQKLPKSGWTATARILRPQLHVGQAGDDNTFASLQTNGANIVSFTSSSSLQRARARLVSICDEMRVDCKAIPESPNTK